MGKKLITSLVNKKYRDKHKLFIAEGVRFVNDIPEDVDIIQYGCTEDFQKYCEFKFRENVRKYIYEETIFNKLTDTKTPQGILAVCRQIEHNTDELLTNPINGRTRKALIIPGWKKYAPICRKG